MERIQANAKTVRELLSNKKYSIEYYQREYNWGQKQIKELIEDLTSAFLEDFEPEHEREAIADYGNYFLGSIIISSKGGINFIIDGQQRLTSLTLLLIYLRNFLKDNDYISYINDMICSTKFGKKSFNIDVDDRTACMEALYNGETFDVTNQSESVKNIMARYNEIGEYFPEELDQKAIPYFTDWLVEKVFMVEIAALSDEDAYKIFETMNDRGLSLSPTEMLKGYLLANITDNQKRVKSNDLWRKRVLELKNNGEDISSDFFKAWIRSQYANSIRDRKKGAKPEDFDRIGTEFHRWIRDNSKQIGLESSKDFIQFIERDFEFYSRHYLRIIQASQQLIPRLEHVLYIAHRGFTLQYMALLAPLKPDDSEEIVNLKLRLVAMYIDILLTRRIWNFRSIGYSNMQYTMFNILKDIRFLEPKDLAKKLKDYLASEEKDFLANDHLYVHHQNRYYVKQMLARIVDYVEQQSGMPSRYMEYITSEGKARYEIEHIWSDHPEDHTDEFPHSSDFYEYRNRIGGLLLLPKIFNASYGDLPYSEKLCYYNNSQNLLARSLHPQCYERNPGFIEFIRKSGLPFKPHKEFKKADLDERQVLLRMIAERIWDPELLIREVNK